MTLRTALFATAAVVAMSTAADAAVNGWYVGLEGGVTWVEDLDMFEILTGPASFNAVLEQDTGWAALGTVGFAWDRWRFELEAGYRDNDIDTISFTTGLVTTNVGELNEFSLMANVLYDIPLGTKFSLTLGAGAGYDRVEFVWDGFATPFEDDDWRFAYQGIVGLNYELSREFEMYVNYRYLNVEGPDFSFAGNRFWFDDVTKHTATLGLRYHFGAK